MRIACIGEAMLELSVQGNSAEMAVAGDTLNTAIYLKRNAPDCQVDYISRLGNCSFSHRIRDFISAQNVGVEAIEMRADETPGLYAITTSDAGERSFTYWRSASAARTLFDTGDFGMLSGYDTLYLSGISLAILPHAVRLAFLNWLGQSNVQLIYDSNYRPRLWDSTDHARQITRSMWHRADIALPSIDDEMALFDETAEQVEKRFTTFKGNGALKRGADGPVSLGECVIQTYPPAAQVVDTTAAGDSFNGGYLAALFSGKSQAQALRAGHDLAAQVVQHRGAIIPA
ncbi:hypothetical protein LCGC14_0932640 [marine sediment metagenome]|uniref:Carbohydrate kinase PfkB domain-containing protein n=1 Tax=marine sediment metagenome TaxID=412755 RepID=A0A0F9NMJ6_9ZZZZ